MEMLCLYHQRVLLRHQYPSITEGEPQTPYGSLVPSTTGPRASILLVPTAGPDSSCTAWGTQSDMFPGAAPDDANSSESLEVIIRLDIQGPEYCNLSFITMSEIKTERYLAELVANLMKEHIKRKSCIVILTFPMNTDVENSTAFAMIRDYSAEERTLGVLTKTDRVQSRAPLPFDKSSFRLGHGFHAVMMQPDATLHREAVLNHEKNLLRWGGNGRLRS
jgi:hypothetical protein